MIRCPMVLIGVMLGGVLLAQGADKVWPPAEGVPITRWGKSITADTPILPEYPRPQFVRAQWQNLNGVWDYAVEARSNARPATYTGQIRVPFPIESVLSLVAQRVDEKSSITRNGLIQ